MEDVQIYLQEEGIAAAERVRRKILGAAAVAAGASTVWSITSHRKFIRTMPSLTANTAIGMAAFAICQEGVRAVRQGDHDAWNSFWAGGLAGAALTRAAYGRGFHLLGIVMWAPICGSLHWLNGTVQPSEYVKRFLASNDLLDLPQQQQQPEEDDSDASALQQQQHRSAAAAAEVQPRRFEELSYREKKREVELIRQREMQQLAVMLQQQERQQQQRQDASNSSSEQQGGRQKWRLFS